MTASPKAPRRLIGWRPVLRIVGSLALLAGLAATIDLGETARLLAGTDAYALAGLVLVAQLQVLLSAARWRLVARRLRLPLGWAAACAEYYLCLLLNQLLPGGVSGDAIRAVRHARRLPALPDGGGAGRALRAVVLERFAGQVAFFAIAGLGLAFWPLLMPGGYAPWIAGMAAALGASILLVLAALALATRIGPRRWRHGVAALVPEGRAALLSDGAWRAQLALNLAVAACLIAAFALAAEAVGPTLPASAWITVVPLTLLALVLPISVGGWGLRESAAALLWPTVGQAPEAGVAAGLLYGLVMLVTGLPGVAAVLTRPRPAPASVSPIGRV